MRVLTIAAFLFSASAFAACPSLSGTYKLCTSSDGTSTTDTVVTQVVKNGVTTYSITAANDQGERTTDTYLADGKSRTSTETDPDSGLKFTTVTTASCVGTGLVVNMKVSVPESEFANLTMTTSKTAQRMTSVTAGHIFDQDINQTDICE